MKSQSMLSVEKLERMKNGASKSIVDESDLKGKHHLCYVCGLVYSHKHCLICHNNICPIHSDEVEAGYICDKCKNEL